MLAEDAESDAAENQQDDTENFHDHLLSQSL
jgi:hypothetical protein